MDLVDYIVVGSGCSGAMAAQTLVEAGKQVMMLDVGIKPTKAQSLPSPELDFLTLRRTDQEQYHYLLGNKLESVSWGIVGKGEQITPPRQYMLHKVDKLTPIDSTSFSPLESLGYGGLGIGWGIGCWAWSPLELKAAGLNVNKMKEAYDLVCKRIGISADRDEAYKYSVGSLENFQAASDMDYNHQKLYYNYLKKKDKLKSQGFIMGRTPLALLTKDLGNRRSYSYRDMDFYSDINKSAYRPWMTIDDLVIQPNFSYIDSQMVTSFVEKKDYVEVICFDIKTKRQTSFSCKKLILASGALGTARIVLRSLSQGKKRLPLLCNPYSYVPCLQLASVGREAERHKLGFSQLSLFLDESHKNIDVSVASLFSYQSLMLFRMARQVPLNFSDSRLLLSYISSGLIIMGIHQPDRPSSGKYLELHPSSSSPTGDELYASYIPTDEERKLRHNREKKYMKTMRKLGVYPLKLIDPGFGSSVHYGGTLPFSTKKDEFTLSSNGRLNNTRSVYVADSSGFNYLSAKGVTFSLMANAHLVAKETLHDN